MVPRHGCLHFLEIFCSINHIIRYQLKYCRGDSNNSVYQTQFNHIDKGQQVKLVGGWELFKWAFWVFMLVWRVPTDMILRIFQILGLFTSMMRGQLLWVMRTLSGLSGSFMQPSWQLRPSSSGRLMIMFDLTQWRPLYKRHESRLGGVVNVFR